MEAMHGGMQANHQQEGWAQGGANLGEGRDRCSSASILRDDAAHIFSAKRCALRETWFQENEDVEKGTIDMCDEEKMLFEQGEICFEQAPLFE